MIVHVFGGKTSRSNSLLHCVESKGALKRGLAYRSRCGVVVRTVGEGFAPGVKGACPTCSRIFRQLHTEPDE